MKSMKKITGGTVFSSLAFLLSIAGVIVYCVNASGSYYNDLRATVIFLGIISAVLIAGFQVMVRMMGEKKWMDLYYLVAAIVLAITVILYASVRVESAAVILGSDLEAGNMLAYSSLMLAFVGIGCFVLAMFFVGISGFFAQVKETKTEKEITE